MSPIIKKVLFSGAILALVAGAMLLSSFLANTQEKRRLIPFFPHFAQNAGRIVLTQGGQTAILTRQNGAWFVSIGQRPDNLYPADSVKVMSIITKIAEMTPDNFVGSNQENFAQFGFENDSTYFVQIYDVHGMLVGDFILGNRAENWRLNFFRRIGDNNVFLVSGGIGFAFNVDPNEWRIRRIFDFNPSDIVQISARHTDQNYTLVLNEEENWIFAADSSIANQQDVVNMIGEFMQLTANDWDYSYMISDQMAGLNNPSAEYTFTLKDGTVHTLAVGNIDGERPRFFVRYNNSPQIAFILRSPILRLRLQPDFNFRDSF
jgi:hypothetical protein